MKRSRRLSMGEQRKCARPGSPRLTVAGLTGASLALLASACFAPREQLLGSLGNDEGFETDASVNDQDAPDPESTDCGGPVPCLTPEPAANDAGTQDARRTDADSSAITDEIACIPAVVTSTSQVRMLTHRQYDRTVRDLLGLERLSTHDNHPPSWLLAPDSNVEVTDLGWESYRLAAQAIAAQVMSEPDLRSSFISCDLVERESCLSATVREFGRRAFRRPLTEQEVTAFEELLNEGADLPTEEAAQILLETFLMSPSFLVLAELNQTEASPGVFELTNFEVAARLSYLLWGSTPDAQLSAAADASELTTTAQILAEAQRMLGDGKARDMVNDFVEQYLGIEPGGRWSLGKDETLFPQYTQAVRDVMTLETQQFFQYVVLGGGSFADLMQSQVAFVNADSAPLYGLSASDFGPELTQVELIDRPGFLSRVGFLSAYSSFDRTSPILRGAFIANNVMGAGLPAIDPASATPLPGPEVADTVRKRVELQTSPSPCMSCHVTINPPGFVLESFDAIGRNQLLERETGAPIDTFVDWLYEGTSYEVSSVRRLMEVLTQSRHARTEYARRWVAFAFSLPDVAKDDCVVDTLAQALARDGYSQLDLIADLTQTPQFLARTVEAE